MRNATDITFLLDRSGSMANIRTDMIGGFNQMLAEQKATPGECTITLIQFDSQDLQSVVIDAKPIASADPLTVNTFLPRGGTPLYEAAIKAIERVGGRLATIPEADRPDKVIFVIVTDGYENASAVGYTRDRLFALIDHQTTAYKWEFAYLGANQDAMQVGVDLGVKMANSMTYKPSAEAVANMYVGVSRNIRAMRNGQAASMSFDEQQRKDAGASAGAGGAGNGKQS